MAFSEQQSNMPWPAECFEIKSYDDSFQDSHIKKPTSLRLTYKVQNIYVWIWIKYFAITIISVHSLYTVPSSGQHLPSVRPKNALPKTISNMWKDQHFVEINIVYKSSICVCIRASYCVLLSYLEHIQEPVAGTSVFSLQYLRFVTIPWYIEIVLYLRYIFNVHVYKIWIIFIQDVLIVWI